MTARVRTRIRSVHERLALLPEARQRRLAQAASLVGVVVFWEGVGRLLGSLLFAPPSVVLPTLVELVLGGWVLPALAHTVVEMSLGFALAVATGVPTGYLMGRSRLAERSVNPVVSGLLVTSTSAMLPMLLVLFGIGFRLRLVVVWLVCVSHLSLSVYHGTRSIDHRYVEVSQSFAVPTAMFYRRVLLLMLLAYGFRLAVDAATRALVPWTELGDVAGGSDTVRESAQPRGGQPVRTGIR